MLRREAQEKLENEARVRSQAREERLNRRKGGYEAEASSDDDDDDSSEEERSQGQKGKKVHHGYEVKIPSYLTAYHSKKHNNLRVS